jgi:prophage maintenance system killer protein
LGYFFAYPLFEINVQQPFFKGNKRVSYIITRAFLMGNGWKVLPILTWDHVFDLIMDIAIKKKSRRQLEAFFESFLTRAYQ